MPLHRLALRVLVALVTSLSLLHLTLEGSGAVCSAARAEGAQGGMEMSGAGPHAGHDAPAASMAHPQAEAAQQTSDHHASAQERCCESMSSCGVTTVASVIERASAPLTASRIPARSDPALASARTAPEPPPPKA
jgi:uncharacterized protein involved in copper resistance